MVLMMFGVALRKESVDRKVDCGRCLLLHGWSLSARRAWIEKLIERMEDIMRGSLSARRAWIENSWAARARVAQYWSLSARRAWIENRLSLRFSISAFSVALRKESVDRKITRNIKVSQEQCRSPQGERG